MPENGAISWPSSPKSNLLLQWRFRLLTALFLVGLGLIWSMDVTTVRMLVKATKSQKGYLITKVSVFANNLSQKHENLKSSTSHIVVNQTQKEANLTELKPQFNSETQVNETQYVQFSNKNSTEVSVIPASLNWVSANLEPNVTKNLIDRWLAPRGEPCKDAKTVGISIPGLDGKDQIELSAGEIYEFGFHALDEHKKPRCQGGDYFETDLSGESWKSRPVVKDFGNGSYSVSVQVHPDFVGTYNLTITLLFRHFEGLKISPDRFAFNEEIRRIPIKFYKGSAHELPELQLCKESDFDRDVWSGRWTRHGKNDECDISDDGRYRCLNPSFPCQSPWCNGSLGSLESNGWVYSTHCSFRVFSTDSAWKCLNNRWLFFWGDSNHVDSIRNILNFILDVTEVKSVPRRFDMNFTNPKDPSKKIRITSIYNGHWNETMNYQGLNSLKNEGFRNLIKKYFSEDKVPDTIIMNSGLHDGIFWPSIRSFSSGASYATSFWIEVMESIRQRGLGVPKVFYRTTVAAGGYARTMAFNPSKMEAFNWILVENLKQAGLLSGVIDNFDMTFPWHFDNRCNDGVHYGRAPAKAKWTDGLIGHNYFVDLMLDHILLNVLCAIR